MRAIVWIAEDTWEGCVDEARALLPDDAEVTLLHVAPTDVEALASGGAGRLLGRHPPPPPGPPLRAVFIRAPWVEGAGPGTEILGTEERTGAIVAIRQGALLATAFHPELTPDTRIHRLFTDIVRGRL